MQAAARDAELLIADGHHRYETARAYAEEIGGEGEHRYVLMCLVALEDPGLTVFPTHRLVQGPGRGAAGRHWTEALRRDFEVAEVPLEQLAPPPGAGRLQLGYIGLPSMRGAASDVEGPGDRRRGAPGHGRRRTGASTPGSGGAAAEGRAGTERRGHLAPARASATPATPSRRWRWCGAAEYDAAFLMRPTPSPRSETWRRAGENMPPKSTYFYPKLLTGLLFNPLA